MTPAARLVPKDRRILIAAGIFVFLLMLGSAMLEKPEESMGAMPSSYSAESGGAKASYLLLQQSGYDVVRWSNAPAELPSPAQGYVLVLAEPFWREDNDQDKAAIEKFLATGGHVLATGYATEILPQAEIETLALPNVGWSVCNPADVSPLTRGGQIAMAPEMHWNMTRNSPIAEYYCDKYPVVVRYPVGKGEVIWWAAATPLTNAALQERGNMQLFLGSVGPPAGVHVLWDEYFHGDRKDMWAYADDTPTWWIFAQLGLLAFAVLFTYFRRSGPIQPHAEPARLSPIEFVETLGGVYHRAKAANIAVQIAFDRFRSRVAHRLGLSPDAPVATLANSVHARLGYASASLESDLQRAQQAAYDYELTPEKALRITQSLHDHLRVLKLISTGQSRPEPSSGD